MLDGHRVVVVSPAGRREYLELLIPHVAALAPVVDEYRLWMNTSNEADIAFIEDAPGLVERPGFVTIEYLPPGVVPDGGGTLHHFFPNCAEPDTVYVRFDDDIVLVDDVEAFSNFVRFRIAHPEMFLVYGLIYNNAVIEHLLQRHGLVDPEGQVVAYDCFCQHGWQDPFHAERLHRQVLAKLASGKTLADLRTNANWTLFECPRVSINCIAWLGSEFSAFGGRVDADEEVWLSIIKPHQLGKPNCVFGGFVVVHYAFFTQRPYLQTTDVLDRYRDHCRGRGLIE